MQSIKLRVCQDIEPGYSESRETFERRDRNGGCHRHICIGKQRNHDYCKRQSDRASFHTSVGQMKFRTGSDR